MATPGRPRQPINHGTLGGYRAHFRHKVPICEPCRNAERVARGRQPRTLAPCGTRTAYHRHLRRRETPCEPCRAANRAAAVEGQQRRAAIGLPAGDPRHGTLNGYGNYRCRCDACTEANARQSANYKLRRKREAT